MTEILKWNVSPRERDALIATYVTSWEPTKCDGEMWEASGNWVCSNCSTFGDWDGKGMDTFYSHETPLPHYTTNVADTWLVLDCLAPTGMVTCSTTFTPGAKLWQCEITLESGWKSSGYGDTVSEAVCITALFAKGHQVQR